MSIQIFHLRIREYYIYGLVNEINEVEANYFQKQWMSDQLRRGGPMVRRASHSCPVAGAAGYFLPHFLADILEVIVD